MNPGRVEVNVEVWRFIKHSNHCSDGKLLRGSDD